VLGSSLLLHIVLIALQIPGLGWKVSCLEFRVQFRGLGSGLWIIQIGCSVDTAAELGVLRPFNVSVDSNKLLLLPFSLFPW
jgi:hypothetical protein